MTRKTTKIIAPSHIELQQAKIAEKAAKKARRKQAEEGSEELRIKLTELIRKQIPQIEKDLSDMAPKERCDTIAKLAPYVLPRLVGQPVSNDTEESDTDELAELASRTAQTTELAN